MRDPNVNVTLYTGNAGAGTGSGKWTAAGAVATASATPQNVGSTGFSQIACSSLTVGSIYYGHWVAEKRL